MGILQNFQAGNMDRLRSVSYQETGTKDPYVTKDVKNPPQHNEISLQIGKRVDDVSRIAQMLVDKPGLTYLGKEALLRASQGNKALNTLGYVARITASTLAQVPLNGTGTHFIKGFDRNFYIAEGAPLALEGKPIITGPVESNLLVQKNSFDNKELHPDIDVSLEKRINSDNVNSTYTKNSTFTGTNTEDSVDRIKQGAPIPVGESEEVTLDLPTGPVTFNIPSTRETTVVQGSLGISNKNVSGSTYDGSTSTLKEGRGKNAIQDFRRANNDEYSFNYSSPTINKETRVGLGNPGNATRVRTSYLINDETGLTVDKINNLDVSTTALDGTNANRGGNRDLIQLEFQVITPEQTHFLAFRAFLEQFDDSFQGQWNASKYIGRADSFYTYEGFERSMNIGFKIAAQSREEMRPLYRKAATLASVTTPTYGQGGRFMRGSIAKVTVGDYIYEQPGIIESVQYTWQKNYPWEIAFQSPEGEPDDTHIVPHLLDVTLSFKLIHDFLPQTGITPLITNHRPLFKDPYIELKDPSITPVE